MPYLLPDERLLAMLREDAPYGDLTTRGLGIGERRGTATFRTRATITACCVEEAERLKEVLAEVAPDAAGQVADHAHHR